MIPKTFVWYSFQLTRYIINYVQFSATVSELMLKITLSLYFYQCTSTIIFTRVTQNTVKYAKFIPCISDGKNS